MWKGISTNPQPQYIASWLFSLCWIFRWQSKTTPVHDTKKSCCLANILEQGEFHNPKLRISAHKRLLFIHHLHYSFQFSPYHITKEQVELFIANKLSNWLTLPCFSCTFHKANLFHYLCDMNLILQVSF